MIPRVQRTRFGRCALRNQASSSLIRRPLAELPPNASTSSSISDGWLIRKIKHAAPQNMRNTDLVMRLAPSVHTRLPPDAKPRFDCPGPVRREQCFIADHDLAGLEHRSKTRFSSILIQNGLYAAPRGYRALSLPVTEEDMAHLESVCAGFIERPGISAG